REEAGSPNVVGAVALDAAIGALGQIGWEARRAHDDDVGQALREGLAAVPGLRLLGPGLSTPTLPLATFVVEGMPHALVAARLSAEFGVGVRHGCFCAHPYLLRLLGLSSAEVRSYKEAVLAGDRTEIPGAVRASAGISTSLADVDRLIAAVAAIVATAPPVPYEQDPRTGDFWPVTEVEGWTVADRGPGASCARG
ncbi:MAG: aminotransferase class V-fold PLP-dependent enzyme, partial [Acidimicrobiales bacterium]